MTTTRGAILKRVSIRRHVLRSAVAGVLILALPSCGKAPVGPDPEAQPDPDTGPQAAALAAVTDSDQTGTAGEPAPSPVTVLATSAAGDPMPGVAVAFAVLEGAGSLSASMVTTGADGRASATWRLGAVAGPNRVAVTTGSLPALSFRATGQPGPAARLVVVTQPEGARVGAELEVQPVVALGDAYANVIGSGTLEVRAEVLGGGTLTGGTVASMVGGQAAFIDLGVVGAVGLRALKFEADGLPPVSSRSVVLLPPPRSEVDRPDDHAGPQVHVVYALPSDGVDRALDTGTELAYSVASFQRWLAQQTGLQLRLDDFEGVTDVTFLRLAETDAQMAARDPFIVTEIERRLGEVGRLVADKIYLVYYDGSSGYACGGAMWPPQLPGQTAAMYLRGHPGVPCPSTFASSPTAFPTYWEFAMLHDALHVLGIVSPDAPNHANAYPAHVPEPLDLMYSGPAPWQIGPGTRVDLGGDDYFGAAVAVGLPNLATAAVVEDAPSLAQMVPRPSAAEISVLRAQFTVLPPHPPFHLRLPGR